MPLRGIHGGEGGEGGRAGRPLPAREAAIATTSAASEVGRSPWQPTRAPEERWTGYQRKRRREEEGGQIRGGQQARLGCEFERRPEPQPARDYGRRGRPPELSPGQARQKLDATSLLLTRSPGKRGVDCSSAWRLGCESLLPPAQSFGLSGEKPRLALDGGGENAPSLQPRGWWCPKGRGAKLWGAVCTRQNGKAFYGTQVCVSVCMCGVGPQGFLPAKGMYPERQIS